MSKFVDMLKKASGFVCMKAVAADEISQAENALALAFASDYKDYVRECGAASFKGHELTGICMSKRLHVVDVTMEARKLNPDIPDDLYVIEEANIDGILIWQNAPGAVYISQPGATTKKVAGSLQEYLKL